MHHLFYNNQAIVSRMPDQHLTTFWESLILHTCLQYILQTLGGPEALLDFPLYVTLQEKNHMILNQVNVQSIQFGHDDQFTDPGTARAGIHEPHANNALGQHLAGK